MRRNDEFDRSERRPRGSSRPQRRRMAIVAGAAAVLILVVGAIALAIVYSPDRAPTAGPQAPPAAALPTGQPTPASAAQVHDAVTIVLADGTRLRQVGVAAPNPDTCQAKQATSATEAELGQDTLTYQLVGQADVYGNQWAYLRVGTVDLGEKLASLGWVVAFPDSPAPQAYNQRITGYIDSARRSGVGLFGSPC